MIKLVIFLAILLTLQHTQALAEPFDLRGFRLGMTLAEFRSTPYPDPGKYKGVHVKCSDDRESKRSKVPLTLKPYGIEAKVGLVRCNHYHDHKTLELPWVEEATLNVAGVQVYMTFDFYRDPKAPSILRLFRINIKSNMQHWGRLWSAYNTKFGQPTDIVKSVVQNSYGTSFNKIVAFWVRDGSSIMLESHDVKIYLIRIVYMFDTVADYFFKQIERITGKPTDKL